MEPPSEVTAQVSRWDRLSRWERAELGRHLRRLGWTYSGIMDVLPVVKGTLAGWCKDIRLTEDQIEAIRRRRPPGVRTGIPVDTQRKRRAEIERIRGEARGEARHLMFDTQWMAGAIMYWAEGGKQRDHLEVANTDPAALRLFIRWIRSYLDPDAEFVLQLHLHEGNDEVFAKRYWQEQLDLPDVSYHRTFIKPKGTGHRKNRWTHGVCKVRVRRSADRWQRITGWLEEVTGLLAAPAGNLDAGR